MIAIAVASSGSRSQVVVVRKRSWLEICMKVEVMVAVSRLFDVSILFLDGKYHDYLCTATILANGASSPLVVNETASLTFGQTRTDTGDEVTTPRSGISFVIFLLGSRAINNDDKNCRGSLVSMCD
jgi:hypothetical protein